MTQLLEGLPDAPSLKGYVLAQVDAQFLREELRAYGLACYQAGLERAARECEAMTDFHGDPAAAAIRALKAEG
jgi:hypothetical protein